MRPKTYKQTADFLNMPIGTLYALVSEGRIPHIRLGNRLVRFDQDEIERWLAERRRGDSGGE